MATVKKTANVFRRRSAKRIQPPAQPRAFETSYAAALISIIRTWNAEVKRTLLPLLPNIAKREDALTGPAKSAVSRLRKKAKALGATGGKAAAKVGEKVDRFARDEMARTVGIPVGSPARESLARFRRENVELVTSVATRQLDELESLLSDAGSMRVESLRDLVFERFDVSESRAALIARDQVLKLNSQIQQEQQQSVGIQQYVWATARDERVREDHQKLDGTTHDWRFPPVVDSETGRKEHPGRDYSCRCQAIPVLE